MLNWFSSYQLVYGRNPNIANVTTDTLASLSNIIINKKYIGHWNALYSARAAFIKPKTEIIRRALQKHGNTVYYKSESSNKWHGPGKVIRQDGKILLGRQE